MVFVCHLHLKEAKIQMNLICFDRNFDHPHVNIIFVSSKKSKKPQFFSTKHSIFVEKVFDMSLILRLSSLFSPNNRAFLKNYYLRGSYSIDNTKL